MSGDVKAIVCADYFPSAEATPAIEAQSLSQMAKGMQGSKILQIAYAVQARIKAGAQVADFTVGDFAPREMACTARGARGSARAEWPGVAVGQI